MKKEYDKVNSQIKAFVLDRSHQWKIVDRMWFDITEEFIDFIYNLYFNENK